MLPVTTDTVRLFLHVLAATVWVGGQITLAALVPVLRAAGPDAPRRAARQFNKLAWAAFVVLIGTGVWNIAAVSPVRGSYRRTLTVKLVVVALSGLAAAVHGRARSKALLAVSGALAALFALGALFIGVLLAG